MCISVVFTKHAFTCSNTINVVRNNLEIHRIRHTIPANAARAGAVVGSAQENMNSLVQLVRIKIKRFILTLITQARSVWGSRLAECWINSDFIGRTWLFRRNNCSSITFNTLDTFTFELMELATRLELFCGMFIHIFSKILHSVFARHTEINVIDDDVGGRRRRSNSINHCK